MMPDGIEYDDLGNAYAPTKAMEEQALIEVEVQDRLKAIGYHLNKIYAIKADYQSYAFKRAIDGLRSLVEDIRYGDRDDYELWEENSYDQCLYWTPVEDPDSFQNGNSSDEVKE